MHKPPPHRPKYLKNKEKIFLKFLIIPLISYTESVNLEIR